MFKDNYQNQMDKITPDKYIKNKILTQLESGEIKNQKKLIKVNFRAAAAVAACIALVFSVVVFENIRSKKPVITSEKYLSSAQSYDNIYKTVNSLIPKNSLIDSIFNGGNKNSANEIAEDGNNYDQATGTGSIESATEDSGASADHSETTTQVDGVDEADIVKTDGKYIYSLYQNIVRVVKADRETVTRLSDIPLEVNNCNYSEMYLSEGRLCVLGTRYGNNVSESFAAVFDISNPENVKKLEICEQSGNYQTSRLIGNKLYMLSNYYIPTKNITKNNPETFVPSVSCKDTDGAVSSDSIYIYENCSSPQYLVICAFDISDCSLSGTQTLLGGVGNVYCNTENIIAASDIYIENGSDTNYTVISKFSIDDGNIELKANSKIKGTLINQFAIDEYNGYFRFVTTVMSYNETITEETASFRQASSASLYVLDENLNNIGEIENLANGERVYSVRFMGDTAYFVTFRNTDPLFSADLSNPESPKIIGELKIPGFSNYLYPYGDGLLLGIGMNADEKTGMTDCVKLSMFDISNPASVTEFNKELIKAVNYSEALYNHKACIVDKDKNIIGFPAQADNGSRYFVYSYDNGFTKKADIKLLGFENQIRGLYIGEYFYIITEKAVKVYNINSFDLLTTMKF